MYKNLSNKNKPYSYIIHKSKSLYSTGTDQDHMGQQKTAILHCTIIKWLYFFFNYPLLIF